MTKIIISTESGADLPLDLVNAHHIQVVPMHVIMEGNTYPDGSIPVTSIYDYYQRTRKIPSTSATNPEEYQQFFKRIMEENPDSCIIHIGYSSKASCTFQNAVIAAEGLKNIYLADSLNVSGGGAAIIMKAVEFVEKYPDIIPDMLIEKINSYALRARVSFIPGNLDYLKAGGRVSNAAYLGASLLQLKPLIEILEGKLISTQKFRGRMSRIVEDYMNKYIDKYNTDKEQIYLLYSLGLDEEIKQAMEKTAREKGFKKITWIQAGCVISTHSGPGAVGIAVFENME